MLQHPVVTASRHSAAQPWGIELPLVGRRDELVALRQHLASAIDGRGHCVLLRGEAGVGKSRLLAELAREATRRDVLIASGSAFAVEASIPYGALADALSRPLRALDAGTLSVLARGTERDLRAIVPGLAGASGSGPRDVLSDAERKAHLLWNVSQFLIRLAARQPIALLLDNAHVSDASSLEFLHLLARQIAGARILIVLAYVDDAAPGHPVHQVARSLLSTQHATTLRIESLTRADLTELLQRSFDLEPDDAVDHAAVLWSHTRGNPFFVDESLKALAIAGRIRKAGGRWLIEATLPATLPATVVEAVEARLAALAPAERRLTEIVAIVESRPSLTLLSRVSGLDGTALADAIDTLCSLRIFIEQRTGDVAEYEFAHPIIAATVRGSVSAARERALHAVIATALEESLGPRAIERAGELARHLVLGHELGSDARALRYLAAAGRDALARRADLEATRWLRDAHRIAERIGETGALALLLEDLATAQARLGDTADAERLLRDALRVADDGGDIDGRARLLLRLAQQAARAGDASAGVLLLEQADTAARRVSRADLLVRIGIARAKMLQALGKHDDATRCVRDTLSVAEPLGDVALLARVHQTALQLFAWTGPADLAREHGARAIALAGESGNREVAWAAHWAMAMLEGFTGDVDGVARHVRDAAALADALASPVLQAMTAEIEIEHASGVGRWDEALAIAERTIPLARAVMPHSLLPRLLVWTGMLVLERDDTERARALFEEAWQLSGAARSSVPVDDGAHALGNVHNVILAHTGMGVYSLSHGDWARALDYGERGLMLADAYGYVAWAIHRLIPMIIEASLRLQNYDRVEMLTARLRRQSTDLGHKLGLAWATAADALVARVKYQRPDAAERLLSAAEALDAVPFVFHGARIRRNAAQVLEADGDSDGAVRELRRAHDVFARLGAEFELRGVRTQLRALGVRLPPRTAQSGAAMLTGRELEIARAVARRLTNKQIGAALDISARTVSTHLSNIFVKLGVDSRGALADAVRDDFILRGE